MPLITKTIRSAFMKRRLVRRNYFENCSDNNKCAYNKLRNRSSRSQMFFKIGVLKHFSQFTGKKKCWSLFLIKTWKILDPEKPGPWKIWTQKNLEPKKSGS